MTRIRALSLFLAALLAGTVTGLLPQFGDAVDSPGYLVAITLLLAIGLLGSTAQVSVDELRRNGLRVLLAVSLGVLAKVLLIGGGLYLVFGDPVCFILGVVVAQIDPLATAADQSLTGLSARARSLLSAWASFDDPVTTLLAVYLSGFVLAAGGFDGEETAGLGTFAGALAANLVFAGVLWLLWRKLLRRSALPPVPGESHLAVDVLAVTLLIAVVTVAVSTFWMLGLALVGLFMRPYLAMRVLPAVTRVAFFVAAFALGLTLIDGVDLARGALLGVFAYLAQIVVGLVVTTGFPGPERLHIALGQQNGITAIILALALEPLFPGTIGTVAPAILCINMLHAGANALSASRSRSGVTTGPTAPTPAAKPRATTLPPPAQRDVPGSPG
ncbi:hypothetical protein [Actinoplanes sp. NPDC049802]|uniref:hypothetical protein n=1 Tax=Actinoplanes sp. NPDC049802 TaxID=3154742 RepID=UPI0033F7BBD4